MGAALLVLIGLGVFTSESMQNFRENSNGNPKYVISVVGDCDTGFRDSGFAYAPFGGIVLKQVNLDDTVGDICSEQ